MADNIFSKEEQLIKSIEDILESGENLGSARETIEHLLKEFKKIYKKFDRIIKISDKQQDELNKKNELLSSLSQKLSKYFSPQIYEALFLGKHDATVKSSRKKLTIFFSDIVNFTSTTELLEPEELTRFLNQYLDEMFSIALKHGATIDKFIGDAILVFFGDPETRGDKDDAVACVSMAIEMRDRIDELSNTWMDLGLREPFKVRMGISTGFVTVGNFGNDYRMDYTIIGSQVNLASRLETSANVNEILISHDTYVLVKGDIYCEKRGTIFVKGIAYPIMTYQVINHFSKMKTKDEINISKDAFTFYVNKSKIRTKSERENIRKTLESILKEFEE